MTEAELISYIRRQLGEPVVQVELHDDQIRSCMDDAYKWFNANKGGQRVGVLQVIPGVSEYELPRDVKGVINVYGVEQSFGGLLGGLADIFSDFGWAPGLIPLPRGRMPAVSGVVLFLQRLKDVWRVAGRDLSWKFQNGKLTLFPTPTEGRSGTFYYDYRYEITNIEELEKSPVDTDLVKNYTFALCKKVLGRIRSKYSALPSAEGNVSLDGATLLEEGDKDIERLNEEIREKAKPVAFITG